MDDEKDWLKDMIETMAGFIEEGLTIFPRILVGLVLFATWPVWGIPYVLYRKWREKMSDRMVTMSNEILYEIAMKAITDLFNDRSVSLETTRQNLGTLIGEIDTMLDALAMDPDDE